MSVKNEIYEIEEAIDVFSDLRLKHEKGSQNNLVVLELTKLELTLHERARYLRGQSVKPMVKRKKGKQPAVGASGEKGAQIDVGDAGPRPL